ncbi:hypothetical protein HF086_000800 [Spodoptera exigua]|uniref:Uncharacterized protein n=1 Tax=Spodoptera exigua TaxID=7107 RepID=A0A922SK95_SPOEX|nr:hypothetical protein HF086_000800 [Spodoptera exigua]
MYNICVCETEGAGGAGGASQAVVGVVLGAKAAAQLLAAPLAGAAVCRRGAAPVLRAATATLAGAAVGAAAAAAGPGSGSTASAGVAGVLVGYPFGGATYALWSRGAPFLLIAAALLADLGEMAAAAGPRVPATSTEHESTGVSGLQYVFLDKEEYNRDGTAVFDIAQDASVDAWPAGVRGGGGRRVVARRAGAGGRGAAGACAGAVLLTTSVMAALEPCLPLWLTHKFHAQRWLTGAVFVPDSAAYLLAASLLGGAARRLGAERVALAGQLGVALAALAVPHARSVAALVGPHAALGAGWARPTRRWCRRCWRATPAARRTSPRCCRPRPAPRTR